MLINELGEWSKRTCVTFRRADAVFWVGTLNKELTLDAASMVGLIKFDENGDPDFSCGSLKPMACIAL